MHLKLRHPRSSQDRSTCTNIDRWVGKLLILLTLIPVTAFAKDAVIAEATKATVGQPAPDFKLVDTSGKIHTLKQYRGKVVVLEWFNPDCPFVKVAHREGKLGARGKALQAGGGVWLAINSGAVGMQGHGKARNQQAKTTYGLTYPILLDESGLVGKTYMAERTPHIYVIDSQGKLVYAGALDSTGGAGYEKSEFTDYLKQALDAVAKQAPVPVSSTKAWGCSVKYQR